MPSSLCYLVIAESEEKKYDLNWNGVRFECLDTMDTSGGDFKLCRSVNGCCELVFIVGSEEWSVEDRDLGLFQTEGET